MSETMNHDFVGYEYKDIIVTRDKENLYADGYQNFGWKLDGAKNPIIGLYSAAMTFKRDRKIRNKAELTRLQRQFDACVSEITNMEKSKTSRASIIAFSIGLLGTAFLAGATFAFLSGMIPLCVVLAIPGFVGWVLPYFCYNNAFSKRCVEIAPLIENKYDEIYEICEKANGLLGA